MSKPLSIAVYLADQNPHRDRSLGITSMTRSLLDQFARRDDLCLTQMISRSSFSHNHPSLVSCRLPFRTDWAAGRLLADSVHPWISRAQADLWYYPKGYIARVAKSAVPTIGTMHDTIVQYYEDFYPHTRSARAFRYWIGNTRRSLQSFDRVLTISQHAAKQLQSFCERYGMVPPEIEVTYEGSSWETQRHVRFGKSNDLVHLASISPHKGTNQLLEHWQTLQLRGRDLPPLRLIGRVDQQGMRILESLRGVFLSPVQETGELQRTLGRAAALILPSEIEGFGLPALESYYVRTPVCFASGTSIDEVVGDLGSRGGYHRLDVGEFEQALDWALTVSEEEVERISEDLYAKFSMHRIADRVVNAFRKTV